MSVTAAKFAARAAREQFFTVPAPCKHGHYSKRYASNGCCVECLTPGKGAKALTEFQKMALQAFSFHTLLPKEGVDPNSLALYLAHCTLQWEQKNGVPSGMNNWGPKINWALDNKKPIGDCPIGR